MFSNLASYIFGSQEATEEQQQQQQDQQEERAYSPPLIISNASSVNRGGNNHQESSAPTREVRVARRGVAATANLGDYEEETDWVLVGGGSVRAATLGSLSEVVPKPPTGSTGSSSPPSDDGNMEEEEEEADPIHGAEDAVRPEPAAGRRPLAPPLPAPAPPHANHAAAAAAKSVKLHHRLRSNRAPPPPSRPVTAKAVERRNKAVKSDRSVGASQKAAVARANLALKSAGLKRQLKQC